MPRDFSLSRFINPLRAKSFFLLSASAVLALSSCISAAAQPQKEEKSNMQLVGYNDLQARSSYQPTIHHQGTRWIAYIGHHGGTDAIPDPVNPLTGKA